MFNIMCFCFWIITVVSEGIQTSCLFARYFYSLCNQTIIIFHTLCLTGKPAWKMFKKVHWNELNIWLGSVSISTDSQVSLFSNVWKVMIVSSSINLVLLFKGNLFIVAYKYIFLIVRISPSCSQRPFIRGDIEDKFVVLLSTNILSMAVLELFWILVPKVTMCNRLCIVNNEASYFFFSFLFSFFLLVYFNETNPVCLHKRNIPL